MDQNYQSSEESIFFTPVKKNAAYYRKQARTHLTGKWKIGFLVSFLAIILGAAGTSISSNLKLEKEDLEELAAFDPQALLAFLPMFIFLGITALITTFAFDLFVSGPAEIGYHRFHLEVVDQNGEEIAVRTLFRFFGTHYFKTVALRLLRTLIHFATALPLLASFVLGVIHLISSYLLSPELNTLLLSALTFTLIVSLGSLVSAAIAIPISYMYTAAPFIMADYPGVGAIEAMRNSRHLMRGHKWKLFCLDLSFIGWMILGALAFGIGIIFVLPYFNTARALFYNDVSGRETAKETEFPSLDPNDYTPD